ncbi:MAG: glycosyltransferase [SAR202 cluster bacterium]|nr:glycosyltransferase [SAR202 cluster bacterium]
MRVLLAIYRDDPRAGGSLRVGETIAKSLQLLGVEAQVCFAYGFPGPVGHSGVQCHYLELRGSRDLACWTRYRRFVKNLRPDIVHFIDPLLAMHLATVGLPFHKIVHVHGAIIRHSIPWRTRLEWKFLNTRAGKVVCITEGARRSLVVRRLANRHKTSVVYNGIDFPWFQERPSREEARRTLRLPEDALVIGMVCRLFQARGCDDLLKILTMLPPIWHALLVGDGPDRPRLERLSQELGVRHRVRFTGALEDVRPAYSAMNAFAFLGLYDSFGLAMAEAMSCRVPVFGLERAGEYREPENPLITDENAVFLKGSRRWFFAQEESPELLRAFAQRVQEYGDAPAKLQSMVDCAWNHVRARFTAEIQAQAMLKVYQSLLGQEANDREIMRSRT